MDEFNPASSNVFQGVYQPKPELNGMVYISSIERDLVVAMANNLSCYRINYSLGVQLDHNGIYTWIYPEDITNLRCDGLVEYCYEFYGFRIFGPDYYWNISKNDFYNIQSIHSFGAISPLSQAVNYMKRVEPPVPPAWPWP